MQTSPSALPATYKPADARRAALACTRLADALDQPTLNQLIKHTSFVDVVAEIVVLIETGMEGFAPGRKLSPGHIIDWARKLASDWSHESLADLALFMKNPGKYDGGEFYATVDVERISKWWSLFLQEKSAALENRHAGLVRQADPWDVLAEELTRMLQARGDRAPAPDEADRERVLRAEMDRLDQMRLATAEGWRKLRLSLKADRRPLDNRSAVQDRLRREIPMMTADDLRAAWKKYPDAFSRRIIQQEASKRGLVAAYLRERFPEVEPGKAEAEEIIAAGLAVPLPTKTDENPNG